MRRLRDHLLHPAFRHRTRASLDGRVFRRVLIVCHGNICRSPYAAAALSNELAVRGVHDVTVKSTGFVGPDRPSPAMAQEVALESGVDLSLHRSTVVSSAVLQDVDLVVAMSPEQATDLRWRGLPSRVPIVILGDLDPDSIVNRTITDPFRGDEAVYRESYRRIHRCIKRLSVFLESPDKSGVRAGDSDHR